MSLLLCAGVRAGVLWTFLSASPGSCWFHINHWHWGFPQTLPSIPHLLPFGVSLGTVMFFPALIPLAAPFAVPCLLCLLFPVALFHSGRYTMPFLL